MKHDRRSRIKELKEQILEVTAGEMVFDPSPRCPPEVEEAFLKRVLWYEKASKQPFAVRLAECGIRMADPHGLCDQLVAERLWQTIHALVELNIIVINTDHLSDRELYTYLWGQASSGATTVTPDYFSRGWYIDATGTGDAGIDVYLRYYASERERSEYRWKFPDRSVPEKCVPGFNRDHLIPDLPDLAEALQNQHLPWM